MSVREKERERVAAAREEESSPHTRTTYLFPLSIVIKARPVGPTFSTQTHACTMYTNMNMPFEQKLVKNVDFKQNI